MSKKSTSSVLFIACLLTLCITVTMGKITFVHNEDHYYNLLDVKSNNLILLSESDSTCIGCQIAMKEFEKTEEEYLGEECGFLFVDCALPSLKSICDAYEIENSPKLYIECEKLAVFEFKDFLIYNNLLKFIRTYSTPKFLSASTIDDVKQTMQHSRELIFGFFSDPSSEDRKAYRKTAANLVFEHQFYDFYLDKSKGEDDSNNKFFLELLDEFEAQPDSVVMWKSIAGQTSFSTLPAPFTRKQLLNWIDSKSLIPIYEGTNEHFQRMAKKNRPILSIFFTGSETSSENINAYNGLQLTAEKFKTHFSYSYSIITDDNKNNYKDLIRWGYSLEAFPIMLIYDVLSEEAYTFPEGSEVTERSITEFCAEYLSGKLSPHIIKQSAPSSENDFMKVVVYDSFRNIIYDRNHDVVVLYYLPEEKCRHCADFLAVFEKVAESLSSPATPPYPDLVFAKMDLFANKSPPGLLVANFPTLVYYPKNDKYNEILFAGKRNFESVANWIKKIFEEKETKEGHLIVENKDVV